MDSLWDADAHQQSNKIPANSQRSAGAHIGDERIYVDHGRTGGNTLTGGSAADAGCLSWIGRLRQTKLVGTVAELLLSSPATTRPDPSVGFPELH
jgi:hypothetical protein